MAYIAQTMTDERPRSRGGAHGSARDRLAGERAEGIDGDQGEEGHDTITASRAIPGNQGAGQRRGENPANADHDAIEQHTLD